MRSTSFVVPILIGSALASCERSRTIVPTRTTRPAVRESSVVAPVTAPPAAWDVAAGPVMLVRSNSPAVGYVVFPQYSDSTLPDTVQFDDSAVRNATFDLFGQAGDVGTARVAHVASQEWSGSGCIEWPTAHLEDLSDTARASAWTVAFEPSAIHAVPLDSIDALSPTDSARLAADIARLASALPDDTSRTFRKIPFSVRTAYRFTAALGVQAVIADVVRKLNQEAMPLEQHTLLLAERDSDVAQSRYHVVYHERSAGSEDSVETTDVLAAVRFVNPTRVALVLLREGPEGSAYALLERSPTGRWRVRWTSVHTGC